jgi:hypothetical protein
MEDNKLLLEYFVEYNKDKYELMIIEYIHEVIYIKRQDDRYFSFMNNKYIFTDLSVYGILNFLSSEIGRNFKSITLFTK